MKIYVSGSSAELELVERYQSRLRKAGHTITHDWAAVVRANGQGNPVAITPEDVQALREAAFADIAGIVAADVFWFLCPERSCGAWLELGFAMGAGIDGTAGPRIIASGAHQSIFLHLEYIERFPCHEEALRALVAT